MLLFVLPYIMSPIAILWTFWLAIGVDATRVVGRLFHRGCNQSCLSVAFSTYESYVAALSKWTCTVPKYLLGFIYYLIEGGEELRARKKPPTNATPVPPQGTNQPINSSAQNRDNVSQKRANIRGAKFAFHWREQHILRQIRLSRVSWSSQEIVVDLILGGLIAGVRRRIYHLSF